MGRHRHSIFKTLTGDGWTSMPTSIPLMPGPSSVVWNLRILFLGKSLRPSIWQSPITEETLWGSEWLMFCLMSQSWGKPSPLVLARLPTPFGVLLMCWRGVEGLGQPHCSCHSHGAASGMYDQTLLQNKSPPLGCEPGALPLWVISGTISQGVGNSRFQAHTLLPYLSHAQIIVTTQLFVKCAKPWCHWKRNPGSQASPQLLKV